MRYATTATLKTVSIAPDSEGNSVETQEEKVVMCNTQAIGSSTFMAARSAGLHADAQIEMRFMEYDDQQIVEYEGTDYDVERVSYKGEYVVLTLARRLDD